MEKRIELERRARKANQITDLNLDNCRSTSIVGLTDEYTALETLSLINVGLTTLKGFPKLPNLKKLELSDNRISNGLHYLTTSPKLQYLNLSGNKIKDLETLKPLEEFKNLAVLDLFNNEATHIENYREKIFEMLPSLKFLDGFDCNDVEAPSDGDEDEEVNDDKKTVFCLNGLEIDLDELEEFEKRVKAKKHNIQLANATTGHTNAKSVSESNTANASAETEPEPEPDDLDEYLAELKLRENTAIPQPNTTATRPRSSSVVSTKAITAISTTTTAATTTTTSPLNFALLLYWFLAILNLASAACYSDIEDDEEDISLSEVYNDDLEEDNSDWDEGDGIGDDDLDDDNSDLDDGDGLGDDDDDDESDEDEADGEANEAPKATTGKSAAAGAAAGEKDAADAADDPQARGKKRKHDG